MFTITHRQGLLIVVTVTIFSEYLKRIEARKPPNLAPDFGKTR
jgi:hypothetical protein